MTTAIVVILAIASYAGLFRAAGGFGAAATALRRWGEASSSTRPAGASTRDDAGNARTSAR